MKSNRRTQADRSATTREALVSAARRLFATQGYAGVGTEAIVRSAGVTRGAMYHQFADKTDLFAAVVESVHAAVAAQIDTAVSTAASDDVLELMQLGAESWLTVFAEPENSRILLVDAPAVLGWERWREIGLRHGLGMVQALLTQAISVGRIPEQPVEPLALVLIGALDEAALYVVRQPAEDAANARAEVRNVIARLINALAVPDE